MSACTNHGKGEAVRRDDATNIFQIIYVARFTEFEFRIIVDLCILDGCIDENIFTSEVYYLLYLL